MRKAGGRRCSVWGGGGSRGVQQGAVHQGAIVTILNPIVHLTRPFAVPRLVGHFDIDRVFGVVEIDDVNVKDQHGRARNEFSYGGRGRITGTTRSAESAHSTCFPNLPRMRGGNSPTPASPYAM